MTKSNEGTAVASVTEAPKAPKFPPDELLANCGQLFSFKPEVLESALAPLIAQGRTAFTISEVKEAVEKFTKREVKRYV